MPLSFSWRGEKRYRKTATAEKFTSKLIRERPGEIERESDGIGGNVASDGRENKWFIIGERLSTEMHTDAHSCNHTHGEAGVVGVSGHTLLAGVSDSLLPNKNREEDEGQSFRHISSYYSLHINMMKVVKDRDVLLSVFKYIFLFGLLRILHLF